MPCFTKVVLLQVSLLVFASVAPTEAAPRQQDSPSTDAFWKWLKERVENFPQINDLSIEGSIPWLNDELKQNIQSIIDEWKPGDYGDSVKPEIRQRMDSLAKQMRESGTMPDGSEVKDFFDDMKAAVRQRIQDLLESLRDLMNKRISLTSDPVNKYTPQVEDFIFELRSQIRDEIDLFLQEMQDNLNDMADSFPQFSREDVEKIINEFTEEAEKQIDEWMEDIRGLFNRPSDSVMVREGIRLFINERTSMHNAQITREEMINRLQSFITQMRSHPSALELDFDFPNATEWKEFFNKTRREMRKQFEEFRATLQEVFDDLRHFNFSDIDFDMKDFINDLVNRTTQRFDQFLKNMQEAMDNVPDSLKPPSREEMRRFLNQTFYGMCEQLTQTINDVQDFLEDVFGNKTDNESTTASTVDGGENNKIIDFQSDLSGGDSSSSLIREDSDIFMAADDNLSLAVGHGNEEDGKGRNNSIGTTAIVLICVGVACGAVVAGVMVRRRILGRKKMYKHVNSPSAAKLQAASLKAMAHSSFEYGTYQEASLKTPHCKSSI